MKTVCKLNKCAGCMACLEACSKKAIAIKKEVGAYNAVIDENICIACGACHQVCQVNNPAEAQKTKVWKQGWTNDPELFSMSSSGGAAGAIERAFVKNGGIVCSCQFLDGKFCFSFARTQDELNKFRGSKYVKSDPTGIYKQLKKLLITGEKVLFVGLPCQVSAVRNFIGEKYAKNLYTADLICHGTPSPEILKIFLKQYGVSINELNSIAFRTKTRFQISKDEKPIGIFGTLDRYTIAFLNGIAYTENCYSCHYAQRDRVSDITLGDSWGSELDVKAGISLMLCQTEKGIQLMNDANLELKDVDLEKAVEHNHQLRHPSQMPAGRTSFLKDIESSPFNKVVLKYFPKQCRKQQLKSVLLRLGVIHVGG